MLTGKLATQLLVLGAILLSHIIPTLVIGFGFVIPGSCIDGVNEQTLGFIASLVGFVVTYACGVSMAWKFGRWGAVTQAQEHCAPASAKA
jgi:ABC-type Fe3+ transport system permease subunit